MKNLFRKLQGDMEIKMRSRILRIVMIFMLAIFSIACTDNTEVKKEITTEVIVNDAKIRLGMSQENIKSALPSNTFNVILSNDPGVICKDINMVWWMDMEGNEEKVFNEDAAVFFYVSGDMLLELEVIWENEFSEIVFNKMKASYGEDYTATWIDYGGINKAYRWDMEDGTSIFYMVEESGCVWLFMAYTKDITEVTPPTTIEEISAE